MIAPDIKKEITELKETVNKLDDVFLANLEAAAKLINKTYENGGKVLICGNGGSAAESQHFSDEMLGRYKNNRRSFPVVSLTADSAAITCIGNDYGFEDIFSRQVEGLGKAGDVLIGISTSGNSRNVIKAVEVAKQKGIQVIALTSPKGKLRELADVSIESPADSTARIQEIHLLAVHLLCEYFED